VRVIPILLKPTELHPRLEALQYLDFSNRVARPWDALIEALQKAVEADAPHTVRVPRDVPLIIKQAITALDSASPTERKAAVETLAQTNHPAAREALAEAVQHPVRDLRIHAALALVQFRDARAVPGLLEALRDKNLGVRIGAAKGLGQIGSAAVPGLLDALRDKDGGVRQYAAELLGEIGDATTVPSLIDALRDEEDGYIRNVAIPEALKQIGTPEALVAVEEWSRRQQGGATG